VSLHLPLCLIFSPWHRLALHGPHHPCIASLVAAWGMQRHDIGGYNAAADLLAWAHASLVSAVASADAAAERAQHALALPLSSITSVVKAGTEAGLEGLASPGEADNTQAELQRHQEQLGDMGQLGVLGTVPSAAHAAYLGGQDLHQLRSNHTCTGFDAPQIGAAQTGSAQTLVSGPSPATGTMLYSQGLCALMAAVQEAWGAALHASGSSDTAAAQLLQAAQTQVELLSALQPAGLPEVHSSLGGSLNYGLSSVHDEPRSVPFNSGVVLLAAACGLFNSLARGGSWSTASQAGVLPACFMTDASILRPAIAANPAASILTTASTRDDVTTNTSSTVTNTPSSFDGSYHAAAHPGQPDLPLARRIAREAVARVTWRLAAVLEESGRLEDACEHYRAAAEAQGCPSDVVAACMAAQGRWVRRGWAFSATLTCVPTGRGMRFDLVGF
jgi:hypothetical protein